MASQRRQTPQNSRLRARAAHLLVKLRQPGQLKTVPARFLGDGRPLASEPPPTS